MTTSSLAGARRRTRTGRGGLLFISPALVLIGVLFIGPLVLTAVMSFFDWPLFGSIEFSGIDNYSRALNDPTLRTALGFTTTFAILTTGVTMLVGFSLAHLVSTKRAAVGVFRTGFFIPVVIGMAAASFLWIWMLNPDVGPIPHLLDLLGADGPPALLASHRSALVTIVIMTVWKSAGFAMLLFLIGLQAIPVELYEAAGIDGAGRWRKLWSVTLPLLRPTTALVLILQFTQNFLAFDQFFLMTKGGPANSTITATYWVYSKAFVNFQLGYGAALAMAVLVVLVAINAFQLRVMRGGPAGDKS